MLASEELDAVVDELVQVHGGYGYIEDYPAARAYRDSRINRIWEGTNEINRLLVPGTLLKRAMSGRLDLLGPARRAQEALLAGPTGDEDGGSGPLAAERRLVEGSRQLTLLLAGAAVQRFGTALEEQQELLAGLADLAIATLTMESAVLRAEAASVSRAGDPEALVDLARLVVADRIGPVELTGRALAARVADGDEARMLLSGIRRFLRSDPGRLDRARATRGRPGHGSGRIPGPGRASRVTRFGGHDQDAGSRGRGAMAASVGEVTVGPDRPWLGHYEAGVPAEVEIPEVTVDGLLRRAAERFPERDALIFYGARTSFRLLDQAVDRFAGYLAALGLVPGDRVSLHLPTSPAFVIAFLGTLRAGCIAVPMSPLLVEREVEVLFRQTRPRLSVAMDLLVPRVAGARTALGDLLAPPSGGAVASGIIATGIKDSLPIPIRWLYPLKMRREHRWHPVAHSTSMPNLFRALRAQAPIRVESVAHPTDPAVLQPTGGTTGTPKAATLTHRNLVANAIQCTSTLVKDDDGQPAAIMCALPYFHIYGLTVALDFALQLGFTQILLPRFVVPETLKAIRRHRPRLFPGAPSFYAGLLKDPHLARYDLSSIEACISGSAPLPGPGPGAVRGPDRGPRERGVRADRGGARHPCATPSTASIGWAPSGCRCPRRTPRCATWRPADGRWAWARSASSGSMARR